MSAPFVTSPALARLEDVTHGFFGRRGGISTGDFASLNVSDTGGDAPEHARANRAEAARALGFSPEALQTCTQIHSDRVLTLDAPFAPAERPEADAMVTASPGLALGILTADCAPILFADPETGVVGAAHAGWKGAISGIIARTVDAMRALGARADRLVAVIGPTIALDNYEVGPEFVENLLAAHPGAANRVTRPDGGREHFDLPGFVFDQLHEAGVGFVHDTGLCTYADARRYFSHRRATHQGSAAGRQIAIIGRH